MHASNLSCIICAYNEAPRIADVLSVATAHHLLHEVIVVDDGSTDGTADIVRSFPSVRLISCPENRGKSRALAEGVRAATKEYLMFLDADLKYLTMANITELAEPIVSGPYEISISVRRNSFAAYRWMGLDFVSGERIIPKRIVMECLSEIDRLPRFGIEVYMNERIISEQLNIAIVSFENVTHTRKTEKMGWWSGTVMDWKTTFDVLKVISPFEVILQNYHMLTLARHIRTLPRRNQSESAPQTGV